MALKSTYTVGQMFGGIGIVCGAIISAGVIIGWVDDRYMDAIRAGDINGQIYHLQSQVLDMQGIQLLYEARLEDTGILEAADKNRYDTIVRKIEAATAAIRVLEQDRSNL